MRRLRLHLLPALSAGALLLSGCGGGDDASDTTDPTGASSSADADADADAAASDGAGASDGSGAAPGPTGSATVAGTTYVLDQVISCDPNDPNQSDGVLLDLTGVGSDDNAQLNVFLSEPLGQQVQSVDWSGPDGVLSGSAMRQPDGVWSSEDGSDLPGAPFQVGVSNVTGSMPMTSEDGGNVDLAFDLPLPLEFSECF